MIALLFCPHTHVFLFLDVHLQKKVDTNSIQYSQLICQNQELKTKCDTLQEKLDNLERTNIRLVQRWAQQVK